MEPRMEIISSDGRHVGHVGSAQAGSLEVARFENTIPAGWVARIDREVILRKTFKEVMAGLANSAGSANSIPMRSQDAEK